MALASQLKGGRLCSLVLLARGNLVLVVDLDQTELQRLPPRRKQEILGIELPVIYGRENQHLCAGISALLRGSRSG